MFKSVEGLPLEAALYVFHDQPIEGKRLIRATTAAYLTRTGELFIGCSCASEGDQFTRAKGSEQAISEAFTKMAKWCRKSLKVKPDAIINIVPDMDTLPLGKGWSWTNVNKNVQEECLRFQLERFRSLLAKRYGIIKELSVFIASRPDFEERA